jgi:pimeloyl-ACP methyl ester carboxylesterase
VTSARLLRRDATRPAPRQDEAATAGPSDHRPIVFVHGVRTSSAIWADQVEAMARSGHPSVAVDLPGHGARVGERFTLHGALDAIGQGVDSFSGKPLVVGLSLGGYSALAYAARHQHTVAGVLLAGCSTEIRGKPVGVYRNVAHHVARVMRPDNSTWHVVTDMLTAMGGHSSLADLRRLLVPVWLVNGRRDVLRLEERRYLAARPGTRLTVVPGAGHDVNTHAPIVFNRILLDVLQELRTGVPVAGHITQPVARPRRVLTRIGGPSLA